MNPRDLFPASLRVREAVGDAPSSWREEDVVACNAQEEIELAALGIEAPGRRAAGACWYTMQNEAGMVVGKHAHSWEEAVISGGVGWRHPIVWCVKDADYSVSARYPKPAMKYAHEWPFPVTDEPIPAGEQLPAELTLMDILGWVAS